MGKKVHFLLVLLVSVAVISISVLFISTAVAQQNPPSGLPQPTPTDKPLSEKQVQEIIKDYLETNNVGLLTGHLQYQIDKTLGQANESINRANDQLKWVGGFIVALITAFSILIPAGIVWMKLTVNKLVEGKFEKSFEDIKKKTLNEVNEILNKQIQQDSIYNQFFKILEIDAPLSSQHEPTTEEKKPIEDQLKEIEKYRIEECKDEYPKLKPIFSRLVTEGNAYYFIQDYDKAIGCYQEALKIQKNCDVLCKKGNALAAKKNIVKQSASTQMLLI